MRIWGNVEKVDILAIGVHPDDVELSCSGTLLKQLDQGYTVGLLDLTEGELGTRGDREQRTVEAWSSAEMLGARFRVILDIGDGFFEWGKTELMSIIPVIRAAQPKLVLCNAIEDRHPDHGRSAKLTADACFLSGLTRVETHWDGVIQERWRPELVLHYIQDHYRDPDVLVDVTDFHEKKMEVIRQFGSQFYDPKSTEPDSPISGKDFLDFIAAKSKVYGRYLQVEYAEGFESARPFGVDDLLSLK